MDKETLYNFIYCGDISFTLNGKDYYICDTDNGWLANELLNGKEYGPFVEYDDLLDYYIIEGKSLREQLSNIADW